jgi:hypothetical protein
MIVAQSKSNRCSTSQDFERRPRGSSTELERGARLQQSEDDLLPMPPAPPIASARAATVAVRW